MEKPTRRSGLLIWPRRHSHPERTLSRSERKAQQFTSHPTPALTYTPLAPIPPKSVLPDLSHEEVLSIAGDAELSPHHRPLSDAERVRKRRFITRSIIVSLLIVAAIFAASYFHVFERKVQPPALSPTSTVPTFNSVNKNFTLSGYLDFAPPDEWDTDPAYENSTLTDVASFTPDGTAKLENRSNLQIHGTPQPDAKASFTSDVSATKNNKSATDITPTTVDGAEAYYFDDSNPTGEVGTVKYHYRKLEFYTNYVIYRVTLQMPASVSISKFNAIFNDFSQSIIIKQK